MAGGLALGKEGPLVHTGACIASLLGQASISSCIAQGSSSLIFFLCWLQYIPSEIISEY